MDIPPGALHEETLNSVPGCKTGLCCCRFAPDWPMSRCWNSLGSHSEHGLTRRLGSVSLTADSCSMSLFPQKDRSSRWSGDAPLQLFVTLCFMDVTGLTLLRKNCFWSPAGGADGKVRSCPACPRTSRAATGSSFRFDTCWDVGETLRILEYIVKMFSDLDIHLVTALSLKGAVLCCGVGSACF